MSGIAVSNRVVARNSIGQFIRDCDQAAEATAKELVDRGAELSRKMAPSGHKRDSRTGKLKNSIHTRMLSRTSGEWYAEARHALAIERGAAPHEISGQVTFFWDNQGRWWNPGSNTINHPGNAPQPYLLPAYQIVAREAMQVAKKHYPG